MNKIKSFLIQNKEILIVGFMIIFTIMLPYMQDEFMIGDDYEYHFSRIDSIEEALREGIFPVKIHPKLANGYGYGSGLFYPNLFLYIPAILGLMGLDFFVAYKIFIMIMLLLMFVLTYVSLKDIVEDKNTTLIGTTIIMLSSCLTLHLYKRIALGEFLGFVFIPTVIAGMHNYIHKDFKKPYLLFIGFFGLINSHLITTAILATYCTIVFIINIKSSIKNPQKLLKLVIIAIFVALTTAYFWMPMLEQMVGYKFKYSNQWISAEEDIYGGYDLFGTERFSLGVLITICLPMIISGIFDNNISSKAKKFACIFIVLAMIMVFPPIWEWTKDFSGIIQFKWRLLGITTVIAGITIAMLLREYCSKAKINFTLVLYIALIFVMFIFNTQYMKLGLVKEDFVESQMYSLWNSIGGGCEYLPLETNLEDLFYPQYIIAGDGEKIECTKTFGRTEFMKTNSEQSLMKVPLIYYYGYVADITEENGNVIPLEVRKTENGLVEIITEEKTGKIRIWYNGTKIQKVSYVVSIVSWTMIFSYLLFKYIKTKLNFIKK